MKTVTRIAALLTLLLTATLLSAQNYYPVTASYIGDTSGVMLANGTICFQATDTHDVPVSFSIAGIKNVTLKPVCAVIGNGAITPGALQLAAPPSTLPPGILYRITVDDSDAGTNVTTYKLAVITANSGGNFDYDLFIANAIAYDDSGLSWNSAASIAVGSVVTGATASVTNVGNPSQAVFNFVLPQGTAGPACAPGSSPCIMTAPLQGTIASLNSLSIGSTLTLGANTLAAFQSSVTACGSVTCWISITGNIPVIANYTIPSNVTLSFAGGQLQPASGVTVTINGNIIAPLSTQIVSGVGTVIFGSGISLVYPEWLGAVADFNGTTGTDNTAAINATIVASTAACVQFQGGAYMITGTLNISASGKCLRGVPTGNASTIASWGGGQWAFGGTKIVSTSPSADTLRITGTLGSPLTSIKISDMTFNRSVGPTGTSYGIKAQYVNLLRLDTVLVTDSMTDVYCLSCQNADVSRVWVDETLGTATPRVGIYLDSTATVQSSSIRLKNGTTAVNHLVGTVHMDGFYINGGDVRDTFLSDFETAGMDHGVYINCTRSGMTWLDDQNGDLHFINGIQDQVSVAGYSINNCYGGGLSSINISGGYIALANANGARGVDIENSQGVNVSGVQFMQGTANTTPFGVVITGALSRGNMIAHNEFMQVANPITLVVGASNNVITGNQITAFLSGSSGVTAIALGASSQNIISNNMIAGYFVNGIYFDPTANSNMVTSNSYGATFSGSGLINQGNANIFGFTTAPSTSVRVATACAGVSLCSILVTWPTPFADANYTATCQLGVNAGGVNYNPTIWIAGKTGANVAVQFYENGSMALPADAKLNCIAIHD